MDAINVFMRTRTNMASDTLKAFLQAHPAVETVELVVTDPSGIARGKWAPVGALKKAFGEGVNFPLSLHGLDVWGNEVGETGLHISSGDRDGFYRAVPETLSVIPWGSDSDQEQDQRRAQVLLETWTPDGERFASCCRQSLRRAVQRLTERGLTAVAAFEIEFHLVVEDETGNVMPLDGETVAGGENQFMYDLQALSEHSSLFDTIHRAASWADLPIDTIIKEAAPGQFEINLNHRADVLRAADDVVMLKRIVQETARDSGMRATFMPKPFAGQPGNGMHVHISILDKDGTNIFSGDKGTIRQHHAVAGLLASMQDATALFVNSINGYRRLAPGSYAPTRANWGDNNRSVALRLPAAPDAAKRVEHRVAGADANPYLLMAALLQGIIDGLDAGDDPPAALEGNAYDETTPNRGEALPNAPETALELFDKSAFVKRALGREMAATFSHLKRAELLRFAGDISPFERATYL
ncbi:glutamine synthetase family protein [Pseudahrensia aquimaris]|uniref:Glutamine synthetase family protein n=1 Tax=Pseudahrensia aquimaris TaxID=744461 RepID=A0ABW3FEL2_9HYPH